MKQAQLVHLPRGKESPQTPLLVTQPYVPSLRKYTRYLQRVFDTKRFTNGGPLLAELETRLKQQLDVEHLLVVNNGTTALQLAYKLKRLTGKTALTTPFTFPATSTALQWQDVRVELGDIEAKSWNLCPKRTEKLLTTKTIDALVPVNIFGMPCDLDAFETLSKRYEVPIIYDSAQAMLSRYKGNSIFAYGDIHCISFHATKLFHCVEGGAIICKNAKDHERVKRLANFGFDNNGQVHEAGINAKMSELHAAMGLCILDELPHLVANRQQTIKKYQQTLGDAVEFQESAYDCTIAPTYMPIKLEDEHMVKRVFVRLAQNNIMARQYFNPANHLYLQTGTLPKTCKLAASILCLPLMHDMSNQQIERITSIVKEAIAQSQS